MTPREGAGKLGGLTPWRRALLGLAGACLVAAAPVAPVAAPSARKLLAPTDFPGWQTHNVTSPVVVRDPAPPGWKITYVRMLEGGEDTRFGLVRYQRADVP